MEADNKKFWEKTARLYAPIQECSNRKLYESVTAHCRPYINSDCAVLELACGSGQLTLPLCSLAKSWEATDFSPKMLEEGRKRCPGVNFSLQDATALTYGDKSFDIAIIANALHIMPEPKKALGEMHRVLKDGGIIIAPTFVYEGKVNRFRMALTNLVGFKTYEKWDLNQLAEAVAEPGFEILEKSLLPGDPLPEGFVVGKKI